MLRIEYIMRESGKTQTDLASASKVNRVIVNRIIRGRVKPNERQTVGLANALDWPQDRAAELFEEIEVS